MNHPNSDTALAAVLAGPNPLDCRLRSDGSMCVIDSAGRKLLFSPNQVAQAAAKLAAARAIPPAQAPSPNPKPLGSPKPVASTATPPAKGKAAPGKDNQGEGK